MVAFQILRACPEPEPLGAEIDAADFAGSIRRWVRDRQGPDDGAPAMPDV
jgi:hypothetical protein